MKFFYKSSLIKWRITKLLRIMRITTLLLLIGLMQTYATNSYSQNTKLSLKMENASIETILSKIEKISEFHFFFRSNEINSNDKHTIDANEQTIDEVLNSLLKDSKLTYKIFDKYIAIVSKENANENIESLIQQKAISGKVTDQSGVPLPGVSVVVKGTTSGVITDNNGNFSLAKVPENATLQFSFVGMKTLEFAVRGKTTINAILAEETVGLDEVVAIGYGTTTKKNIVGSITSIKSEKISATPALNPLQGIAGELPGLTVINHSDQPGSSPTLLIRGVGTTGNSTPLIIMDGFQVSNSDIAQLDANEIESITILKDAASAAVYGNRGGNGIMLVTTKRGKLGKTSVSYSGNYALQTPTYLSDPVDGYTNALTYNLALKNDGKQPVFTEAQLADIKAQKLPYGNTNWFKEAFKNATQQSHSVGISGGTEAVKYFIDYNYTDQKGLFASFGSTKNSLRTSLDIKLTPTTDLSIVESYRNSDVLSSSNGISTIMTSIYSAPSYTPVEYAPGKYSNMTKGNPLALVSSGGGYNKSNYSNLYSTISIKQQLPIKGLSILGNLNYINNTTSDKTWRTVEPVYNYDAAKGSAVLAPSGTTPYLNQDINLYKSLSLETHLNYAGNFNDHSVSALLLYTQTKESARGFWARRSDYTTTIVDELSAGGATSQLNGNQSQWDNARRGVVGRFSYNYKEKYFIEHSFRTDWSDKFAPGKRMGYFPSLSAGWIASDEAFIRNIKAINYLKFKASWGQLGSDYTGAYQFLSTYNQAVGGVYGTSNVYTAGVQQGVLPNANLTWELITKKNIGFESKLFNNLIGLEFDLFFDHRTDILATSSLAVPATFGSSSSLPVENLGIVDNHGFEIVLTHSKRITEDFSYNLKANIAYAKNKIVFINEAANVPDAIKITGRSIGVYQGYTALGYFKDATDIANSPKQPNVQPGDIKFADLSGPDGKPDNKIDAYDRTTLGMGNTPELTFGLSADFNYKRLSLSMLFQGASGFNLMLNSQQSMPFLNNTQINKDQLDYWTPSNLDAKFPRLSVDNSNSNFGGNPSYGSSKFLYDGTYVRLKLLRLSYTLPKLKIGKSNDLNMKIFVSGSNLFTFAPNLPNYADPEIPLNYPGWTSYDYAHTKLYNLGLTLNF